MLTPPNLPTREEFLRTAGLIRVNLHGQEMDFRYPDNIYMRNVVTGILQGREYPLFNLPGYTPTTIVDVGANVGAAAWYFHNTYPTAEIWCYEPCQSNFWCLEANTRPFANIHPFHYGLLDRDCELPIYHGTSQSGQNSLVQTVETSPASVETVKLVKASSEAGRRQWRQISILKMDTEGSEVPILAELLGVIPSIDMLYCEYHDEDDRHEINALTRERFVLAAANAGKPHQGMCVYWSRELLARYPAMDAIRKSVKRSEVDRA